MSSTSKACLQLPSKPSTITTNNTGSNIPHTIDSCWNAWESLKKDKSHFFSVLYPCSILEIQNITAMLYIVCKSEISSWLCTSPQSTADLTVYRLCTACLEGNTHCLFDESDSESEEEIVPLFSWKSVCVFVRQRSTLVHSHFPQNDVIMLKNTHKLTKIQL